MTENRQDMKRQADREQRKKEKKEQGKARGTRTEYQENVRKIQKKAIRRLVTKNVKKNRARSAVLVLAVMLVTMLMTVFFGAGISMYSNMEQANLRMKGTVANGGLYMATEKEMEQIAGIAEVSIVGWQQFVAEIEDVPDMPDKTTAVMTAYDRTAWEKFILPTVSDVTGEYPQEENEIMVSEWMLDRLGIEVPKTGQTITLTFTTLSGETEKQEFILSGIFRDYIYSPDSTPNSGNTQASTFYYSETGSSLRAAGNIIVSGAFAEKYGTEEGKLGNFLIDDSLNSTEALALLNGATGNNTIFVSGLTKTWAQSLSVALLPILAVLLVMVSGYLLIYNIVNISVLQEMHMYGQLKTLGADTGQLKRIVKSQVNLVTVIGIPLGMIVGTVFAVLIVPDIIAELTFGNGFGDKFDTDIVISPFIYLFSAVFAYLTVRLSCRKSMRMAAKVSPVEALRYVEDTGKTKAHRTNGGGKMCRMAYRNVFRGRKRAVVTILSLFFGFVVFLAISAATTKMDYGIKFDREQPGAFTLRNLSFHAGMEEETEDVLDREALDRIRGTDGVTEVLVTYEDFTQFEYTKSGMGWLEPYIEYRLRYEDRTREEIETDFRSAGIGLPVEKFADFTWESTLSDEEIQKHLEDGTGIFLTDIDAGNGKEVSGKTIRITERTQGGDTAGGNSSGNAGPKAEEYTVLGILTLDGYEESGKKSEKDWRSYGDREIFDTEYYTSYEGLSRLKDDLCAQQADIYTVSSENGENERGNLEGDTEIKAVLDKLFADAEAVEINSQIETRTGVEGVISTIELIGAVIAGFLVFLGMINFVNVIFTNIHSRQRELATLESIGMTKKQLKLMLTLEGVYYSVITIVLLATVGMALAWFCFCLVRSGLIYFAAFTAPTAQLIGIFIVMLVVCAAVPLIVFANISKESVVERLRKGQE